LSFAIVCNQQVSYDFIGVPYCDKCCKRVSTTESTVKLDVSYPNCKSKNIEGWNGNCPKCNTPMDKSGISELYD